MGTVRRLILWDIDGTLISSGSITRRAFDLAVASAVGREPGEHGVSFGGKTDPQIALEILTALAVSAEDARGQLPAVMQALEREMGAAGAKLRRPSRAPTPASRPAVGLERLRPKPRGPSGSPARSADRSSPRRRRHAPRAPAPRRRRPPGRRLVG